MKKVTRNYSLIVMVGLLYFLIWGQALADDPQMVSVAQPRANDTVSSLTMVAGSADFSEFERYEIFLNGGGDMVWVASGYAPIVNGNLARLDPRVFIDGTYQIVIRQVRTDSNYTDHAGPTITIDNPFDAPLPYYPEIASSILRAPTDRALLRVENCSGHDLNFDYHGPTNFSTADDSRMPARKEGSICTFFDAALSPGEYRGTAHIDGGNSNSYQFDAEAGKVYKITYNGPDSGHYQLIVAEIESDTDGVELMGGGTAPVTSDTSDQPTVIDANEDVSTDMATDDSIAVTEAESEADVLPTSGGDPVPASSTTYLLLAILFMGLIVVGGVVALQRGRRLTS
ncbi:hypothetical protein QUF64_15990 [Anaerolineales bacterium HSG6]|nr:hypothetical protein [Anaerolineales bacterium HSG6]